MEFIFHNIIKMKAPHKTDHFHFGILGSANTGDAVFNYKAVRWIDFEFPSRMKK
jgi:hypothetical protein